VKVISKDNEGTATQVVEYYYDHANRWIRKLLDPDGDTGSEYEDTRIKLPYGNG